MVRRPKAHFTERTASLSMLIHISLFVSALAGICVAVPEPACGDGGDACASAAGVGMLQRQRRYLTAKNVQLTEEEEEKQNKLLALMKKLTPGKKKKESDLKKLAEFAADISDNATKNRTQTVVGLMSGPDEKFDREAVAKEKEAIEEEMKFQ